MLEKVLIDMSKKSIFHLKWMIISYHLKPVAVFAIKYLPKDDKISKQKGPKSCAVIIRTSSLPNLSGRANRNTVRFKRDGISHDRPKNTSTGRAIIIVG